MCSLSQKLDELVRIASYSLLDCDRNAPCDDFEPSEFNILIFYQIKMLTCGHWSRFHVEVPLGACERYTGPRVYTKILFNCIRPWFQDYFLCMLSIISLSLVHSDIRILFDDNSHSSVAGPMVPLGTGRRNGRSLKFYLYVIYLGF